MNANRMTEKQIFHYILSFDDATLIKWYNNDVVEPFSDYSDQIIRENTEQAKQTICDTYGWEALFSLLQNKKTAINEDDKYIMVDGADSPYIVTFSTFEEFLTKQEYLCAYIKNDRPELLDYLDAERAQDMRNEEILQKSQEKFA